MVLPDITTRTLWHGQYNLPACKYRLCLYDEFTYLDYLIDVSSTSSVPTTLRTYRNEQMSRADKQ